MAHTLNDTFLFCHVNGIDVDCHDIMTTVKTDAGKLAFERVLVHTLEQSSEC